MACSGRASSRSLIIKGPCAPLMPSVGRSESQNRNVVINLCVEAQMSNQDRDQFRSAVKKIKSAILFEDWEPAMAPLTRLAMFDMLPVIDELGFFDRSKLASAANLMHEQKRLS